MKLLDKLLGRKTKVISSEFVIHDSSLFRATPLFTSIHELTHRIKHTIHGKYLFDAPYDETHIKLMKELISNIGSLYSNLIIDKSDVTLQMVDEVSHNLLSILNLNTDYKGKYLEQSVNDKIVDTNLSANIALDIIIKCMIPSGILVTPKILHHIKVNDLRIMILKD